MSKTHGTTEDEVVYVTKAEQEMKAEEEARKSCLQRQEGGTHYKEMKIQPIEFILANKLPYCEANIIKYVCRHKAKNGAQDIRKAIQYAMFILEHEYGEKV